MSSYVPYLRPSGLCCATRPSDAGCALAYQNRYLHGDLTMPKPNYAFAKRQKDLAKKEKQEQKRLRKAADAENKAGTEPETTDVDDQPSE